MSDKVEEAGALENRLGPGYFMALVAFCRACKVLRIGVLTVGILVDGRTYVIEVVVSKAELSGEN